MNLKYVTYLTIVLIFLTINSCDNKSNPETTIRLAHALNTSHPVHLGMVRMAELVNVYSNGSVELKIFPNQQLGSERESLELLQIGSIGMTKVSSAALENFVPELRVYSLPYLFGDSEHVKK